MAVTDKKKKPGRPKSADRHKPRKLLPVEAQLYEQLAKIAERNRRPVTWEARIALEKHIEAESNRAGPPADDAP